MEEQTRVGRLADAFTTAGGIQDRRSQSRALLSMGMLLLEAGKTVEAMKLVEFIPRSAEHTSELQSLMRISYAVFCLKQKNIDNRLYNIDFTLHIQRLHAPHNPQHVIQDEHDKLLYLPP